jgi:hypothetical protein
MTRRISRNPATASGQTCIELIASALSKLLSSNGKALHGTVPQVDTTPLDSGCVPSASLVNHLPRLINARYMPRCRELRQALNNHSGAETHFQHAVVWSDLKEVADPGAQSAFIRAMMMPPNLPRTP